MVQKPHLNLVFIGHVDHGKSTVVGRLLFEKGDVGEHIIRQYKEEAEKIGKATFEFAWVMDRLKEERQRGLTIDIAHSKMETDKYYFTVIDAPGHRDFVKNMITGASQADAAVLAVDVGQRDEKGGLMPQTKEHIFLARTLGIGQIIAAINKMDTVKYDQKKYEETKALLQKLFQIIGYKPEQIIYLPLSGLKGDNVIKKGDNLKWFDGPTLAGAIDSLKVPEKPVKLPLRLPVQDVYSITGIGTVPVGRVETGIMKVGDTVIFEPAGVSGEVKTIEMHHESIPQAEPGDNIGFNVRGVGKTDIKRGDVCGHATKPPTVAKEFTAQIVILQHPSAITVGYTPVFHAHTAQVACRITELISKLDPKTGNILEKAPKFLKTGDAGVIRIEPTRPMVIEKVKEIPQMGRFAIRDMGTTIAAGMVVDITPAK
ncbi:MAG: translation elongation factor EF-1 subunit alpha [Candidatus Hydrothermarchaeota archaeon]|nr:translation elongation factor EF-1 subunit alpha [Candidatus Hydrothermarchaeota archaeon]